MASQRDGGADAGFHGIQRQRRRHRSRMTDKSTRATAWHDIVRASLKANDVKLIVYVPDRVFTPLIEALHADAYFTTFAATREEEALGIVTGAWMGGMRGAVPNALASLVVPSQIPAIIFVSERGTLGEFNLGQALVHKTMRPVLNSLAVENVTITRQDELGFILDRSIKQAVATQAPVTFILSPLLTGGKAFEG
jgi:sulfopyruvate decarboxylase TPP-binding subunit